MPVQLTSIVLMKFVVGSLPCSERFFSGYSGFPFFPKTNTSKFQFDQEVKKTKNHFVDVLPPNHYLLLINLLFKFGQRYSVMKNIAGGYGETDCG